MDALRPLIDGDRAECAQVEEEKQRLLADALSHYVDVLQAGERFDIRAMFRLVALWVENHASPAVNAMLGRRLSGVPAAKFLPLIYQIASRLSSDRAAASFQSVICK